jgi:hypothetical protein
LWVFFGEIHESKRASTRDVVGEKGKEEGIRKDNRRTEYGQIMLYACMEIP